MRLHASVAAAALMLACGSDRIAVGSETESETGTVSDECPPEPLSMPIPCVIDSGCPATYIEYDYDLEAVTCILEALRDRKLGSYSFTYYTGYTHDEVKFQILDDTHVQWTRWQFDDTQTCSWWEQLGLLKTPEYYQECLDKHAYGDFWCLVNLADESVPEDSAVCPAP